MWLSAGWRAGCAGRERAPSSTSGSSSSVKVLSAAAAARALAPAAARHARGEWRSLGRRRAGVRRAEVGVRWRAAPGPAGCVRWHEQLQARGGVVEDDGVERRSGAAASAALVVHQEDEKARLGSGTPVLRAKGEFPSLFRRAEHRSTGALAVQF